MIREVIERRARRNQPW